jgi:threonine dehydrogenase-like Zn-dependent dehydrogenase
MRALILEDFWRLSLQETEPPRPALDELLVEVAAVGICGSDVHGFTGENGRRVPGQLMGHEAAGRVVGVGRAVAADPASPRPGTPVALNPLLPCGHCPACRRGQPQRCPDRRVVGVTPEVPGAFAQLVTVPAASAVALPPGLPVQRGALVEPLAVAVHALRRAPVGAGDVVLVIGGGPIGQSLVLAAEAFSPAVVVVSEPNPARRAVCADLGAVPVDPGAGPLVDQVRGIAGRAADVTVEAVGLTASLAAALAATAVGGSIVLVGLGAPRLELPAYEVSAAERSVVGSFCYTGEDFRAAVDWAGDHPHRLDPLIAGLVGLAEAPAAFAAAAGPNPPAGKILVTPTS